MENKRKAQEEMTQELAELNAFLAARGLDGKFTLTVTEE